jgi:hypothetical protein
VAGSGAESLEVVDWADLGSCGCVGVRMVRERQDVEAEVAASFGPFVVLLGQDGADEAIERVAVGKIPTMSVRLRISRLSRSWGLLDQIWRQISLGKLVKASTSAHNRHPPTSP